MLLSTLSLAALSLSGSTAAPLPTAPTQHLAFIDSLVNSITPRRRGSSKPAIRCITPMKQRLSSRESSAKAMKEVEFAKKQYPKALNFVTQYQSVDRRLKPSKSADICRRHPPLPKLALTKEICVQPKQCATGGQTR